MNFRFSTPIPLLLVTPRARRARSDRRCTRHGQGTTLRKLGVIASSQCTDKEQLLAKDLAEGHRDELIPHYKERDSETVQVWTIQSRRA